MQQTANHLRETIALILPFLEAISEQKASVKPAPNKWSNKEIIGHLIDSACNNQQKFVRAMRQPHLDFVGYEQDFWVNAQSYQTYSWKELLDFWAKYNVHIAHIIQNVKPEVLQNTITINGGWLFTLEFIMQDYTEHLKHHLKQILPDNELLKSEFVNVYKA
jgi:hypothetical protein